MNKDVIELIYAAISEFAKRLKSHYPHSYSIKATIDRELLNTRKELKGDDDEDR